MSLTPRKVGGYGWVPDLPDARDHTFKVVAPRAKPPTSVDRRKTDFGIYDQSALGSCVGNGCVGAYRNLLRLHGQPDYQGSRLAAYYLARQIEGTTKIDAGAQIRDGVKAMAKVGVVAEKDWPYLIGRFDEEPPADALKAAADHQAIEYLRVDNTDWTQVQSAIATYGNLIFGISVYESFESDAVAKSGRVPMPRKTEKLIGGHCMRAVGYTSANLIVANSWSSGWGSNGYCLIPRAYITNPDLCGDAWVLRVVE